MMTLKLITYLCLCVILNSSAVPITQHGDQTDNSVRPIEEIFAELDGNHQTNKVNSQFHRDGVVKPIEEIFEELDNYNNDSSIEVFSNDNTHNDPIKEFLRNKRQILNPVRPIEEIFEELDNSSNYTETEALSVSYNSYTSEMPVSNSEKLRLEQVSDIGDINYHQTTDRFTSANVRKVKRSTDQVMHVRPIEELFQELDLYQNSTAVGSDVDINLTHNYDKNNRIKSLEDQLQEQYDLKNNTTDEEILKNIQYSDTNENIRKIKRSADPDLLVRPIEEIFADLDTHHNYTDIELNVEVNKTKNVDFTIAQEEARTIKPIEDLFEELDNYHNSTTTEEIGVAESVTQPVEDIIDNSPNVEINESSFFEHEQHNTTYAEMEAFESNEIFTKNSLLRNSFRPGMVVNSYVVDITPNVAQGTFSGSLLAQVSINDLSTIEDPIMFLVGELNIVSVVFSIGGGTTFRAADFFVDEGLLEIESGEASLYTYIIEYEGQINQNGNGLYMGLYDSNSYLAMNLNPIYARNVFPCMDEPTEESTISFTFSNIDYNNIVANSLLLAADNNQFQFTPMLGPPHRWGMVAHNFVNVNNLISGGRLFVRSGLSSQEAQTMNIINAILTRIEDWTQRPYEELHQGQNERLDIFAMPDITKDWNALSSVAVWEPHILMSLNHGPTQRKTAMVEIAKAITNQWFGYVIYPENWRYQWINTGLSIHSSFEILRAYQGEALDTDNTVVDINAVFVAEFIQESLLRDGYSSAVPLELSEDIFEEAMIRDHVNGLVKYKAPAILWMLKNVLGQNVGNPDIDYVQGAARALLNVRALQPHNSLNFYDALNSDWLGAPAIIDEIEEFLEPWVTTSNYPIVNVQMRTNGVILTQERFSLTNTVQQEYSIPITYTSSVNPNFDDTVPHSILDASLIVDMFLDEEDWFLANIQGQGYYRVNYDDEMWERIIEALEDPETRNVIHPLNRATLVDDALNLARSGRLLYDIAFRVVLTMEHETDYSVWKAFIRNMNFIKIRLEMLVDDDEDLDPDIYLRMVRRTVIGVENELGFYPDPLIIEDAMASITRGLVMEHACKSGYQPCIAAAIDWFYDPNTNEPAVNPNIPHDIRPAVYCTMMREGDDTARQALLNRYDTEVSHYERLVVVRALACSSDESFLLSTLQDAAAGQGRFGVQERAEFFKSLIESRPQSADLALRFIRLNTNAVRDMFGGAERLEEFIVLLAENMADDDLTSFFDQWVDSVQSNLDDSVDMATRVALQAQENMVWVNVHMPGVYEWIDENDASTIFVSLALLTLSMLVHAFN